MPFSRARPRIVDDVSVPDFVVIRRIGIVDVQRIVARAAVHREEFVDRIDRALRRGRHARKRRRVAADVNDVIIVPAVDVDRAVHGPDIEYVVAGVAVERRDAGEARAVDVDRVRIRLAVHEQQVGHVIDMDGVGAGAGVERRIFLGQARRGAVRAVDRERVVAAAERDVQVLDGAVGDADRSYPGR